MMIWDEGSSASVVYIIMCSIVYTVLCTMLMKYANVTMMPTLPLIYSLDQGELKRREKLALAQN